jgi:hypothetical protein
MRRKALSIAVSLTLMIGLLLVSGVAWAQAEKTSINYLLGDCNDLAEPEREWVDEEGIRHIRDVMYRCERRRQISGVEIGWYSGDIDLAGDHRFFRAYYSFTGLVLGEPATGVGRVTEECNRIEGVWNCTGHDVLHLHSGELVTTSATWKGGGRIIYSGVLLDPPGGESRQGPRPRR